MTGFALRVSCATPVLGPALGMSGIGLSSILAGEASRRFGSHLRGETRRHRSAQAVAQDAALDAIMGITLFKVSVLFASLLVGSMEELLGAHCCQT